MIFLSRNATCEYCGSKDLQIEVYLDCDPLWPDSKERLKCCNCGKIISKDYEEETE
jgi:DNA-directed RNA polymerase subunit RPC12/RpoP